MLSLIIKTALDQCAVVTSRLLSGRRPSGWREGGGRVKR